MAVTAIIGAQWGDEGKGKIVDLLAEKARVVVRFSGGDNAGHTVINRFGRFALHLVPSGIFSETDCIIGHGVVVNPEILIGEIENLNQHHVDTSRLHISDRAHVIMPYHLLLDGLEEDARGGNALGTTRRGIGPAYADKAARQGIRAGDLLTGEEFLSRLRTVVEQKNAILTRVYGLKPCSVDEIYQRYVGYGQRLAPYISDVTRIIDGAVKQGRDMLLEGAQGSLLDNDLGTYPYTTSSCPLASGACLGSGLNPKNLDHILGVYKVYTSRVGAGPMPTELKDSTGDKIRERAHEYGTTTGRPRRCGWFDGVAARYSSGINGFTAAALTRLDVLDGFDRVKISTAYRLGDKVIDYFPASISELMRCEPVYEELPGWQTPTTHMKRYEDLPEAARRYIARITEIIGCPVTIISVGPAREETIFVEQH